MDPRKYPDSFRMIAQTLKNVGEDFEAIKTSFCNKGRVKIAHTIKLLIGDDLQPYRFGLNQYFLMR